MTSPDQGPPQVFGDPPADADDWSDDQWLAWLRATDPDYPDDRPVTALGRLTRSSGGQALGQAMLGLANAMYGRNDDEVVVVRDRGDADDGDQPFAVRLDPDHPVVVVRTPPPGGGPGGGVPGGGPPGGGVPGSRPPG
ncbi:MAG TPA: hypothetical protein VHB02_11030 [Acidimicrobiales bacterium]|nr:hypothetical protein [Acidimicrobiales bacterium]